MERVTLLLVLCVGLGAIPLAGAADEETEAQARRFYASAFRDDLGADERAAALEALAKDYADTRWADDALWVLGEMADRGGDRRRAILFRRQLLQRQSPPQLEELTRSLPVYRHSRIPQALFVLDLTGKSYRKDGGWGLPFNPVPMMACEDLAFDYEGMELFELALREYRRAARAAPPGGLFRRTYERHARRLEKKIETLKADELSRKENEGPEAEKQPPEGEEREQEDSGAKSDEQDQHSEPSGKDSGGD